MKRWSLILILGAAFVLTACAQSGAPAATVEPTLMPPVKADAQILMEGAVVPVRSARLSFTTSGVVTEILVEEGQTVNAGQTIARLSGSQQLAAAVAAAEVELLNAQQDLDRLHQNADQARAEAQLALVNAQDAYDKAKEKRESKQYLRTDQETLDIARANYIIAEDGVKQAESYYDRFSGLPEDDPMRAEAFSQLAAARQRRDKALANMNWLLGKPDAQEIAEADANLEVAKANLDAAQRRWEQVKHGLDADALALAEARLKNAQAQLEAAKASLAEKELKAPFAATVAANDLKVGELVSLSAAPVVLADMSAWQVETSDLTELNVVNIEEGEPVTVTFDAIPELELPGRVVKIRLLGENRQGDITYKATIALEQQDARLRWNMTVAVKVK